MPNLLFHSFFVSWLLLALASFRSRFLSSIAAPWHRFLHPFLPPVFSRVRAVGLVMIRFVSLGRSLFCGVAPNLAEPAVVEPSVVLADPDVGLFASDEEKGIFARNLVVAFRAAVECYRYCVGFGILLPEGVSIVGIDRGSVKAGLVSALLPNAVCRANAVAYLRNFGEGDFGVPFDGHFVGKMPLDLVCLCDNPAMVCDFAHLLGLVNKSLERHYFPEIELARLELMEARGDSATRLDDLALDNIPAGGLEGLVGCNLDHLRGRHFVALGRGFNGESAF